MKQKGRETGRLFIGIENFHLSCKTQCSGAISSDICCTAKNVSNESYTLLKIIKMNNLKVGIQIHKGG